jgi:dUTPase
MLANSVGIIDESYRGELIVAIRVLHPGLGGKHERDVFPTGIVFALDAKPVSLTEVGNLIIAKKARIAQMILRKRIESEIIEVDSLSSTERGSGGFGSTG